ncbi:hypothetical protein HMPREF0979_00823 [Coprobacillus sp. 8_1_38FAA]|nr:hypothetical protein HMPREF0979_00823 [Coprobacillus sp. 8_1_38FAA]
MRSRSILDIEGGNIIRQIDNELERVIYNINDESTDLKAREIKISIKITPNKKRNELAVKYNVTSKVSPKDNEPITLVNLKEFDNDTGEFFRISFIRGKRNCSRTNQSFRRGCQRTSANCCWE